MDNGIPQRSDPNGIFRILRDGAGPNLTRSLSLCWIRWPALWRETSNEKHRREQTLPPAVHSGLDHDARTGPDVPGRKNSAIGLERMAKAIWRSTTPMTLQKPLHRRKQNQGVPVGETPAEPFPAAERPCGR